MSVIESFIRRDLPTLLATIVSILVFVAYFVVYDPFNAAIEGYTAFILPIIAAAFGIGYVSLMKLHIRTIMREFGNWESLYSIVLLGTLHIVILGWLLGGAENVIYAEISNRVYMPVQMGINSILVYHASSAAVRSYRARNIDSFILVVIFLIVVIGQMPIFEIPAILSLRSFVLDVLMTAGVRGLFVTLTLGVVILALRLWMGWEKSAVGGVD
jgi:hypothetical protein